MYNRRKRFLWIPFFVLLSATLLAFAVMWLWNNVLVDVAQVRTITFWQAAGLMLLSRLLFGNVPGRGRGGRWNGRNHLGGQHWKAKWEQMSEEEKTRFREQWRRRRGGE